MTGLLRRATFAVLAALAVAAHAQSTWPTQPIRMIVPFPPGATTDIAARAVAQRIQGPLGQPVLVENRPGANGTIGMDIVAKAKPDGYTLVVGSVSSTAVPATILKAPSFDLLKDFQPVAVIAGTTLVLLVNSESPYHSLADLVAAAKKAPGTLSYGNSAGLYQLAMESLKMQAGVDLISVSYKGPTEAANDLIGGRLTVTPDSLGSATRMIQAGKTRPIAVLSGKRTPSLPDLPTMQELGYKDFDFNGWIGILAPAGTPDAVVQRLHQEMAKAVAAEDMHRIYESAAIDPITMSPAEYRKLLAGETAKYEAIVKAAGIEKQ